jgi:hypothetical protein
MIREAKRRKTQDMNLHEKTQKITDILKLGTAELSTLPPKQKEEAFSEESKKLLEERQQAINNRDMESFTHISKQFRKSKKRRQNENDNENT